MVEATERINELKEAGASDITGSCTLVQSIALNRSGVMPDLMIRSLPYPGTGFQALPESLDKLRAAFTWKKFDPLYDYTWEARRDEFGEEMKSRAPILTISDMKDLKTGDLVIGGSSGEGVHMYMFLNWSDCRGSDGGCTRARVIDNTQNVQGETYTSSDGQIRVDGRTGLDASVEVDLTRGIYSFIEGFRLPDQPEEH